MRARRRAPPSALTRPSSRTPRRAAAPVGGRLGGVHPPGRGRADAGAGGAREPVAGGVHVRDGRGGSGVRAGRWRWPRRRRAEHPRRARNERGARPLARGRCARQRRRRACAGALRRRRYRRSRCEQVVSLVYRSHPGDLDELPEARVVVQASAVQEASRAFRGRVGRPPSLPCPAVPLPATMISA